MFRNGEVEKPKERGKHRTLVENEMIRRREKEFAYQQTWSSAQEYFKRCERANTKYDSWTSPRYYEDNNKLMAEIRSKREKEELLSKRREKLKKLLDEEARSYEIELMIHKTKASNQQPNTTLDEIPTEILKKTNDGLKLQEEERRRREAETKLYEQWRKNNPFIRQYESKYKTQNLKLSWLDQQIEKQMQREKEEEESKRILRERDEKLKKAEEQEELRKLQLKEKSEYLKHDLELQIAELREKQKICNELKRREGEDNKRMHAIRELMEKQAQEERKRTEIDCALYNIRHHKLRLKKKAADIEESLIQKKLMLAKLREMVLEDAISDQVKKTEIRNSLEELSNLIRQHQQLEQDRQKHLDFLFDSEAEAVYAKQANMWRQEEESRSRLLKSVMSTVKNQILENVERNRAKQRQLLEEREEMMKKLEEYEEELKKVREEEEKRKTDVKKMLDDDVKVKNAKKKLLENVHLREINEELERIRKEEQRLEQEILKIQQRQGPYKPPKRGLFY